MKNLRIYLSVGDHMPLFPPIRYESESMTMNGYGRFRECGFVWLCFSIEWRKEEVGLCVRD